MKRARRRRRWWERRRRGWWARRRRGWWARREKRWKGDKSDEIRRCEECNVLFSS